MELRGGFEDVHPALQPGEGRDTVGSEGDDHAAEDGFTVVKHSTECVDDPGNEALKLLPLRDHNAGGIAPVVTMTLTASHFNSNAQRSPAGGCPSVASIGGTGFPVAAHMPSTARGLVQVCRGRDNSEMSETAKPDELKGGAQPRPKASPARC